MNESESSAPDVEKWKKDILRLRTRHVLRDALLGGLSLSKAKENARDDLKNTNIQSIIENFISNEFLIDEKTNELLTELSVQLREKFPNIPNLSIISLGSLVHGGFQTKQLLGVADSTDFDWAINADIELDKNARKEIKSFANKIIPQLSETVLGKKLHGCYFYNPTTSGGYLVNFGDVDQAYEFLTQKELYSNFLLLFHPSFPSKTNDRNKELILEALSKLKIDDYQRWKTITTRILSEWQKYNHNLREKHMIDRWLSESKYDLVFLVRSKIIDSITKALPSIYSETPVTFFSKDRLRGFFKKQWFKNAVLNQFSFLELDRKSYTIEYHIARDVESPDKSLEDEANDISIQLSNNFIDRLRQYFSNSNIQNITEFETIIREIKELLGNGVPEEVMKKRRDFSLAKRVSEKSGEIMSEPMKKLLGIES